MSFKIHTNEKFKYLDEGEGEVLLLLHGLFGIMSNWHDVVTHFASHHRVIVPLLPIYEMPMKKANLEGLLHFIEEFIDTLSISNISIIGNSLGGHIGILYALAHQDRIDGLILTGSSGLFENTMGVSYPQRRNYKFIQERVSHTFYDPKIATKALIDNIYGIVNNASECLRIVSIARSAQKGNVSDVLPSLKTPTLLIWGLNDTITPPIVAHEFNRLIPNSELRFIDFCCHAPMMEQPQRFNTLTDAFLQKIQSKKNKP